MKNINKTVLCDIPKCYTALGLIINGSPALIYAGEGDGSIQALRGSGFQERQLISSGGGGTMSLVPIPDQEGWFFASRGFYSMVDCQDSEIDIVRFDGSLFVLKKIASLPYLHRFGMIAGADGTRYLVAATLHSHKDDKEDWSHPGHLYYGVLPSSLAEPFHVQMVMLPGDYYIHHGFYVGSGSHSPAVYTSSREGVFKITPPNVPGGAWQIDHLIQEAVSDIAVLDIDGDGKDEIAALLPFHGDQCKVYRDIGGTYAEIYRHPPGNDFYHTAISATLSGRPVFLIGARKGDGELFLLSWEGGQVSCRSLDREIGPCSGAVLNTPDADYLLIASRYGSLQQAVCYTFPV